MSVKRWIVIAVILLVAVLLYAPTQTHHFVLNFREAFPQLLTDFGLRSG